MYILNSKMSENDEEECNKKMLSNKIVENSKVNQESMHFLKIEDSLAQLV